MALKTQKSVSGAWQKLTPAQARARANKQFGKALAMLAK
jgi:hypothetical protein